MANTDIRDWESDLRANGWKPYKIHGREYRMIWQSPEGELFRGPYGAWRMMQSQLQWSCKSPFHHGCPKCEVKNV